MVLDKQKSSIKKMFLQKQFIDFWRDITSIGSTTIYATIVIMFLLAGKTQIAVKLTIGYVIIYAVAGTIKIIYFKNRPRKEKYNNLLEKIDASSFPSIHSARAILLAAEISRNTNSATTIFLFIIAALICYSRIAIKKHYWIDVVGGVIFGVASFFVVNNIF